MVKKLQYKYILLFFLSAIIICYILLQTKEYFEGDSNDIKTYEIPFYTERKNKDGPKSVSEVPLVIYRSWMTNKLTNEMKNIIDKSMQMNPEFDSYLYTDDDCINFIKDNFEPNVLNAFKSLKPGAYKCDLWRYCILYKKGGVYIDIKLELITPLINIIKEHPIIFLKDRPWAVEKRPIWNGLMCSPPSNPVFLDCINSVVQSCKNKDYKRDFLDITGPSLLGEMTTKHYGENYYDKLPFDFNGQENPITYNKISVATQYKEYRKDQEKFMKTRPYKEMYDNKDVFDESIKFI